MDITKSPPDAAKNNGEEGSKIGTLFKSMDILLQRKNPVTEFFRQWPDLQTLPEIVGKIESWQNDEQSLMENFMAALSELIHRQGIPDRIKFAAVKFLEKIILSLAAEDGATNLGFMLELLPGNFAVMKTSVSIVIINSLVEIAKRRPEFCGRVLQVLVDLNPDVKSARGHMGSLVYAFKAAFLALLRCPHWGALPWRDRLLAVLRGMHFGEAAEQAVRRADRARREKKKATREMTWTKNATREMTWKETTKKPEAEKLADVAGEGLAPALQKLTVGQPEGKGSAYVDTSGKGYVHVEEQSGPAHQMIGVVGALLEKGEKGCEYIEVLVGKMDPDLLADVVIANMWNLPTRPADVSTVSQSGIVSTAVTST